mmetsp:Transcript_21786/g.66692  ORF Transcript_21786/g.66692 Transcript_21786/m.66692 type:complete len:458 (+) Transcript_21786:679-2052(+)
MATCWAVRKLMRRDLVWRLAWARSPLAAVLGMPTPPRFYEDATEPDGCSPSGSPPLSSSPVGVDEPVWMEPKHYGYAAAREMRRDLRRCLDAMDTREAGATVTRSPSPVPDYSPSAAGRSTATLSAFAAFWRCEKVRRRRVRGGLQSIRSNRGVQLSEYGGCVMQFVTLCQPHELVRIIEDAVREEDTRPLARDEKRCPLPMQVVVALHAIIASELMPRAPCVRLDDRADEDWPTHQMPEACNASLRWIMAVPRRLSLPPTWERDLLAPSFFRATEVHRPSADDDEDSMDICSGDGGSNGQLALRGTTKDLLRALERLHARVANAASEGEEATDGCLHVLRECGEDKSAALRDHDVKVERFFFGALGPMFRGRDVPSNMSLHGGSLLSAAAMIAFEAVARLDPKLADGFPGLKQCAQEAGPTELQNVYSVLDFIQQGHRTALPIGTKVPRVSLVPRR